MRQFIPLYRFCPGLSIVFKSERSLKLGRKIKIVAENAFVWLFSRYSSNNTKNIDSAGDIVAIK
jgi:hypothetical protein